MNKEKAIWLIAGGSMQVPAALEIVNQGFKLILTDRDAECPCAKYAKEFIEMDTFDITGNLIKAEKLLNKFDIRAVLTIAADCHTTVAVLARFLGLHGIDPEISKICRVKHLTREVLREKGIPQPKFIAVKNIRDAYQFIAKINSKIVIKATDNSGSRGISFLNKDEELTSEKFERAKANGTTGYVIIEEFLDPIDEIICELSVETLWYNGKSYWLNWVDRLFRKDYLLFDSLKNSSIYDNIGGGIELGHINPAIHDLSVKQEVEKLIDDAGKAIGMGGQKGGHILKADIILTKRGPFILELTPRLSGGWDSSGTTPARNANFIGGVIKLSLREQITIDLWHDYFNYKNPSLNATILTKIPAGALDSVNRQYALGKSFDRNESLKRALSNLMENKYVIPME
ncbi:MAG: ATP-grasp domain-containing protein [Planctomycetes bacterium]|nr:ATP-grasp domain-containing protein [Planctomycetota bacterium]